MDPARSDNGGVPPVHILRERVGKSENEGGMREVVKVDVFKRYEDLEKTVFALDNKRRDEYLLHFHLESHDRCDVKLKDGHWDKGAYFRSSLLSGGALRLIPHFVPLAPRPEGTKKRGFEALETAVTSPRPQKKRMEGARARVLPAIEEEDEDLHMASAADKVNAPAANEILESIEFDDTAGGYVTEEDQAEGYTTDDYEELERERQAFKATLNPKSDTDYNKFSRKSHGKFAVKAAPPLPPGVTYETWRVDFAAAKQRYIGSHSSHSARANAAAFAHREMIRGKYGMVAVDPCSHCIRVGATCHVYHSDCLNWSMDVQNKDVNNHLLVFGWRCERCRCRSGTQVPGGCNAMHEC